MKDVKIAYAGTELYFSAAEHENGIVAVLTGLEGSVAQAEIPAWIGIGGDMCPVTAVARKALMGNRRLQKLTLPESVVRIDDWAFAGCRRLREVRLPRAILGKGVFQECDALRRIYILGQGSEDVAALLAQAARHDVVYLQDLSAAGTEEWLRQWDAWLLRFLEQSDQEGYSGQVPCGEEDYGSSDVGAYESGRRREKAERCLLRLMFRKGLASGLEARLRAYIAGHTSGSAAGEEAWQMLLQKHAEEKEWYRAFAEAGGLHEKNRDRILSDIPEEYAEMKAFFIGAGQKQEKADAFFAGLAL